MKVGHNHWCGVCTYVALWSSVSVFLVCWHQTHSSPMPPDIRVTLLKRPWPLLLSLTLKRALHSADTLRLVFCPLFWRHDTFFCAVGFQIDEPALQSLFWVQGHRALLAIVAVCTGSFKTEVGGFLKAREKIQVRLPSSDKNSKPCPQYVCCGAYGACPCLLLSTLSMASSQNHQTIQQPGFHHHPTHSLIPSLTGHVG